MLFINFRAAAAIRRIMVKLRDSFFVRASEHLRIGPLTQKWSKNYQLKEINGNSTETSTHNP